MSDIQNLSLLDRALLFAVEKHAGTWRKGTTTPYFTHVAEAMAIVSEITTEEEIRAAAVLHDTLEDTETTLEELQELFGPRVAALVASESENKREGIAPGETWEIRKGETIRHLERASTESLIIALGDKLSNARAMYRDYQAVGEKLWDRFNQKDPAKHGWYYGSIGKIFQGNPELSGTPACAEYLKLVGELFGTRED